MVFIEHPLPVVKWHHTEYVTMSDVEGMGWLERIWLYGFGPLELVDEEDGVKYYATRSLKRSFKSVERS